jgi:hypothetical protein
MMQSGKCLLKDDQPAGQKSFFGLAGLISGVISDLILGAHFGVAYLSISPGRFSFFNNLTALVFCILTPFSFGLAVVGLMRKADSKTCSWIAIFLVTIPFAILFVQFVLSFINM